MLLVKIKVVFQEYISMMIKITKIINNSSNIKGDKEKNNIFVILIIIIVALIIIIILLMIFIIKYKKLFKKTFF